MSDLPDRLRDALDVRFPGGLLLEAAERIEVLEARTASGDLTHPFTDEQLRLIGSVVGDLMATFVAEAVSALTAETERLQHQLDLWNPGRLPFDSRRNLH